MIKYVASMNFLCIFGIISCENPKDDQSIIDVSNDIIEESDQEFLLSFLNAQRIERFEADGFGLNEVLRQVEDFLNKRWPYGGPKISITTSSGGEFNPEVVIVLQNVKVSNLLDIISDQSNLSYRILPENKIYFFSESSAILFDGEHSDDAEPSILPPPDSPEWQLPQKSY